MCVVYTFVYYSSGSVSTTLVPVHWGRYHDGVQRNTETNFYGNKLLTHTTPYQTNLSNEGVTKAPKTEAMNIVIDSPEITRKSSSQSAPRPVTLSHYTQPMATLSMPIGDTVRAHEDFETSREAAKPGETLPRVLLLYGTTSTTEDARAVQVLLEGQRIQVTHFNYYWKKRSPSLTTERNGKRVGSFAVVIVVDSILHYGLWSQSKQEPVLDYCREYQVPLLFVPSAGKESKNSTVHQEIKIGSDVWARSVRPGSILFLELNSSQSWFYYVKAGLKITKFPSDCLWTVFQITAKSSPVDHMMPAFNHTQGHVTSAPNEPSRDPTRNKDKLHLGFEAVLELAYHDSNSDGVKTTPVLMQDRGLRDGVRKVFIGGPAQFWLTKLLILDVMRNVSNQRLFRFGRQRWVQVDVDDIFIAPDGTKMTTEDVWVGTAFILYSGAPLLWTPWRHSRMYCIEKCPHFRSPSIVDTLGT